MTALQTMTHLFINVFGASAGGGLTYARNVLPHLAVREAVQTTVLLAPALRREIGNLPRVQYIEAETAGGVAARFWFEQSRLPQMIRGSGADVLISAGNFALWNSPVPQILLSRNALYTSSDFLRDVRKRGDYSLWLDTSIKATFARASIRRAEATVAPSAAFADELQRWSGREICTIHHGFDPSAFRRNTTQLPQEVRSRLHDAEAAVRLLFVSHFNYYRNFGTLLRALPLLKERLAPKAVRLFLTCKLTSEGNPGSYRSDFEADLVRRLGIRDEVVELGTVPYSLLHQVYEACSMYVTPAYAESFAHPLVEAMASGLPVIASDLPVHREICQDAALYFFQFSPRELADRVMDVILHPSVASKLRARGIERSPDFSWSGHVEELVELAIRVTGVRQMKRTKASGKPPQTS